MLAKYKYQLLLLLVVILCYFPLTFFQSTLLNDDIDVALSTKYFAGECFQQGLLPLWNPYQISGFPAHADLQYTNWNVEVLLTGILFGYNYVILHLQCIIYLFLAALGTFLLSRYLSKSARAAFYIACIYLLSGLVTAHMQSLVTILGLVWLPYVVLYFLLWLQNTDLKNTLLLCLFSYLLVTLGYQAFAFMVLPFFIVLFFTKIITHYKAKDYQSMKYKVLFGVIAVMVLLILLSPVLVTQLQSQPFVSRLNGMAVEDVMSNPFPPIGLISFINPLLTIGHDQWFNTDVTMRNVFIGTLPFLLVMMSLFKKNKTTLDIILLSFAFVYLLGSFGDATPIRQVMYYLLPGFKLFRFPSLLRVVAILFLLCYLALNFSKTIELFYDRKKLRLIIFSTVALVLIGISGFCFSKIEKFTFLTSTEQGFNQKIIHTNPLELVFYTSVIQLFLIVITYVFLHKEISISGFKRKTVVFSLIELTVIVLIYGQFTAFTNVKPQTFQGNFARLQRGFPFPSKDAINETKYKFNYIEGFWKNTGAFKKQLVNDDAWTSFYFMNYDRLTRDLPDLKDSLQSYPFIYFSVPQKEIPVKLPVDTSRSFIRTTFHPCNKEIPFQYTFFSPAKIAVTVNTPEDVILNLQQSYFTGWLVNVDGIQAPILWNAGLLMSVSIPKGAHSIEFTYQNPGFVTALIVSYSLLVCMIFLLIGVSQYSKNKKWMLALVFMAGTGTIVFLFYSHSLRSNCLVQNNFSFNDSTNKTLYDFNSKADAQLLHNFILTNRPKKITYQWTNFFNTPELLYYLGMNKDTALTALTGTISFTPFPSDEKKVITVNFDSTYTDKVFIDTTRQNGFSLALNELNPYSKLMELPARKITNHNVFGLITLKSNVFANATVVCHIKHADGVEESFYFPLNKYVLSNSRWQTIPYYFELKHKTKPTDSVNLFLINGTKHKVFIKTLTAVYFP